MTIFSMKIFDFGFGRGFKIDKLGFGMAKESEVGGMQRTELEAKRLGRAFWAATGSLTTRDPSESGPWKGGRGDG